MVSASSAPASASASAARRTRSLVSGARRLRRIFACCATSPVWPGLVVGLGNGMLVGYLMYRSGLVPRPMAVLGLVGGPLVCASGTAMLFGVIDQGSGAQVIATVPEMLWEASLRIYLIAKGFKASSAILGDPRHTGANARPPIPATAAA